jgi:hypothetical protein
MTYFLSIWPVFLALALNIVAMVCMCIQRERTGMKFLSAASLVFWGFVLYITATVTVEGVGDQRGTIFAFTLFLLFFAGMPWTREGQANL